jgi:hypothetical protein
MLFVAFDITDSSDDILTQEAMASSVRLIMQS